MRCTAEWVRFLFHSRCCCTWCFLPQYRWIRGCCHVGRTFTIWKWGPQCLENMDLQARFEHAVCFCLICHNLQLGKRSLNRLQGSNCVWQNQYRRTYWIQRIQQTSHHWGFCKLKSSTIQWESIWVTYVFQCFEPSQGKTLKCVEVARFSKYSWLARSDKTFKLRF